MYISLECCFSDCNTLSDLDIIELVDAKTKLSETKCVSEIGLIEAKTKTIEAKTKTIEAKTNTIEAKTKTIEAKTKTIEAKCLSEAEIIKLIDSKLLETKNDCRIPNNPCPISESGYVTVNDKCIYFESLEMNPTNAKKNCLTKMKDYGFGQLFEPRSKSLYISHAVRNRG